MLSKLFNRKSTIFIAVLSFTTFTTFATSEKPGSVSKVTTEAKQTNMTPKTALLKLKEGNQRFMSNNSTTRNYLAQAKESSYGQFPWAIILNCMDSRSVPEFIFDQGLADLFTLRVAGNVLNEDILGSMEYGSKVVGAKLIVVMAHTHCGAIAGACENVQLGHLDHVLAKIAPAITPSKKETGINNCADAELLNAIAKNNALQVAREISEKSPIIHDLIAKGQIGIVAGIHDIKTGQVTFFEEGRLIP